MTTTIQQAAAAEPDSLPQLSRVRWIYEHALVPGLFYLLAWVVLTWPRVTQFLTDFYCDPGDGYQNVWNLWWMRISLTERLASPWWTDMLFWPRGASLVAHTLSPYNGAFAIPLAFLPDWVVYNILLVLTYVLGGLTAYWLTLWITSARVPALLAGGYYAFSPFHFSHTESHLQLASFQWMPLFVLCLLRIFENPSWKTGLAAGLALLLVESCDWYYTFFSILGGILITAWACLAQRRLLPLCAGYRAAFGTLVAVGIGPLLWFVVQLRRLNESTAGLFGNHEPRDFSANLIGPLVPGPAWYFRDWSEWSWRNWPSQNPGESTGYVGWVAMLMALYAVCTRRRGPHRPGVWVLIALVFFALALGPQLQVWNRRYPAVPMPYWLLEKPLESSGCPGRFLAMTTLAMTVLLAMGLARAAKTWLRPWPCKLVLLAAALFELWPYPHVTTGHDCPDVVEALRRLPGNDAVHWQHSYLETPTVMFYQTRFFKPVTTGYVSRIPMESDGLKWELANLVEDGRYNEAQAKGKFRYLVLPRDRDDPELQEDWKVVYYGAEHDIWVDRRDDWLPAAPRLHVPRGPTEPVRLTAVRGHSYSTELRVEAPGMAGRRIVVMLSGKRVSPVPLPGGATLALQNDPWMLASCTVAGALFGTEQVILDAQGQASVTLKLPATTESRVVDLCAQALVVCEEQSKGFCASSRAVRLRLRP